MCLLTIFHDKNTFTLCVPYLHDAKNPFSLKFHQKVITKHRGFIHFSAVKSTFIHAVKTLLATKYSRMDRVKIVKDSL